MASMPGVIGSTSPRSDAASGHDTDTPGSFQRGKRKYSHTTAAQRQCLLEWLELPGNFELLTKPVSVKLFETSSNAAPSSPPLKRVKKIDGYRSLAQYMNRVAVADWTEKTARSRFESFMAAYRKAKRQYPHDQLHTFYQRVDALFGPDGDREATRFESESLGQKLEGSRSPLLPRDNETEFQDLSAAISEVARKEQGVTSPPRRRVRTTSNNSVEAGTVPVVADTGEVGEPPIQELTPTTSMPGTDQTLKLERQRLAVRQQELELKQTELRARQEENRQNLRAEVLTKLVEAGKSPAEVREYLAIMDPVDTPATRR
ncbi:uncharacterized protein PITG_05874 [Phytophthora infestans T30-4]|uniref:Uncharacterized protein n=2 Tax=Phytophthora infestans TaxID=4787 RepID=D0N5W3_PHYIT|nr:uncharacterized protein PITG_05874 [Phytophthora infestans T30-4]EEY70454.1 conserved hypothetical protein [Phytophthora infestans T30-4]KAF4032095.1 hypothetical protein GN244_ATG16018 [Phytophthora infestans]KAI9988546.1 hypothetical protein PInf_021979 [Phytophthora infestans]|eukprot:XP_002998108.1 conserved hypothetical protein [Phytophthora infestans T30-4]